LFLEQLEHDLRDIIYNNKRSYEVSDLEYKQLQNEMPELESVILRLRENAISLWAEINTYRSLLLSLLTPAHPALISGQQQQQQQITEERIHQKSQSQQPSSIISTLVPVKSKQRINEETSGEKYRPSVTINVPQSSNTSQEQVVTTSKEQRETSRLPPATNRPVIKEIERSSQYTSPPPPALLQTQYATTSTTTNGLDELSKIISVPFRGNTTSQQKQSDQQQQHQHSTTHFSGSNHGTTVTKQVSPVNVTTNITSKTTGSNSYQSSSRDIGSQAIIGVPYNQTPVSQTTTIGTKTMPYIDQYRDEATGFIVHIEDGIIWVRI